MHALRKFFAPGVRPSVCVLLAFQAACDTSAGLEGQTQNIVDGNKVRGNWGIGALTETVRTVDPFAWLVLDREVKFKDAEPLRLAPPDAQLANQYEMWGYGASLLNRPGAPARASAGVRKRIDVDILDQRPGFFLFSGVDGTPCAGDSGGPILSVNRDSCGNLSQVAGLRGLGSSGTEQNRQRDAVKRCAKGEVQRGVDLLSDSSQQFLQCVREKGEQQVEYEPWKNILCNWAGDFIRILFKNGRIPLMNQGIWPGGQLATKADLVFYPFYAFRVAPVSSDQPPEAKKYILNVSTRAQVKDAARALYENGLFGAMLTRKDGVFDPNEPLLLGETLSFLTADFKLPLPSDVETEQILSTYADPETVASLSQVRDQKGFEALRSLAAATRQGLVVWNPEAAHSFFEPVTTDQLAVMLYQINYYLEQGLTLPKLSSPYLVTPP